jgi:hypothetical protein
VADKTEQYLASLAAESFKREIDADENIWRSMPFFATALVIASALVPTLITHRPALSLSFWSVVANLTAGGSVLAMLWAFRWFLGLVRLRDYQYPPNDVAISQYAADLREFHILLGDPPATLDHLVHSELRAYITKQFAEAAARNRVHNVGKAQARSQALLFIVIGFGLAFFSEATIFVGTSWLGERTQHGGQDQGERRKPSATPCAATASRDMGRCEADPRSGEFVRKRLEKMSGDKSPPPKPTPPPPPPQIVKKNDLPPSKRD